MAQPASCRTMYADGGHFCSRQQTKQQHNSSAPSYLKGYMEMRLQAVGMIRRLKQDVLADLPPKRRMRVPILTDPACTRVRQFTTYAWNDMLHDKHSAD